MPTSKKSLGKRRAYHHGDLRRALLQAAWRLVKRAGLPGLTLREVAREVGVTHAAPYHHFATRSALLDALAEEAFVGLEAAMRGAHEACTDPGERLYLIGRAYVDFARDKPEQLQVMFRPRSDELEGPPPPSLAEVGARAFAQLYDAVVECQKHGVAPAGEDPHQLALAAWSVVHGFALLWVDGPLDFMPPYAGNFEHMRDATLRAMVEGSRLRALRE